MASSSTTDTTEGTATATATSTSASRLFDLTTSTSTATFDSGATSLPVTKTTTTSIVTTPSSSSSPGSTSTSSTPSTGSTSTPSLSSTTSQSSSPIGVSKPSTSISSSLSPHPNTTLKSVSSVPTTTTSNATKSSGATSPSNRGSPGSGSGGLSTGAKVGIAVGIVGGLAVVGVILAVFLKKRSRRQTQQYPNRSLSQAARQPPSKVAHATEKIPPITSVWTESSMPEQEVLLPQQADDATVQSRFSTLYDQIELHIENFYMDTSHMIPPATENALSHYDTPLLSGSLAHNLEESPRATALLKHVLSYEITTTTISPTSGKRSLLPADLLTALQGSRTHQDQANPDIPSHLRYLASIYRQNPTSAATPHTIASAQHFTSVFSLWSNPSYTADQRTQHLSSVLSSAVDFAIWLFSQPDMFELHWEDDLRNGDVHGHDQAGVVTVPALVKVTAGPQRTARKQVLSRAIVRRI